VTKFLLDRRPDLKIYGTDISPRMVELARLNNPSATFDVLDCRQMKSLERKFDALVCGFCLPYLNPREAEQLIGDIHQTLVPKGILYLSTIHNEPINSGLKTNSAGEKTMMYYYLGDHLIQLLAQMGFVILNQHLLLRGEEKDVVIIAER
jgi:trans-aconitate methyltransferase